MSTKTLKSSSPLIGKPYFQGFPVGQQYLYGFKVKAGELMLFHRPKKKARSFLGVGR